MNLNNAQWSLLTSTALFMITFAIVLVFVQRVGIDTIEPVLKAWPLIAAIITVFLPFNLLWQRRVLEEKEKDKYQRQVRTGLINELKLIATTTAGLRDDCRHRLQQELVNLSVLTFTPIRPVFGAVQNEIARLPRDIIDVVGLNEADYLRDLANFETAQKAIKTAKDLEMLAHYAGRLSMSATKYVLELKKQHVPFTQGSIPPPDKPIDFGPEI